MVIFFILVYVYANPSLLFGAVESLVMSFICEDGQQLLPIHSFVLYMINVIVILKDLICP